MCYCTAGTDTTDCNKPNSCKYADNGVCEKQVSAQPQYNPQHTAEDLKHCKTGTDTKDCTPAVTTGTLGKGGEDTTSASTATTGGYDENYGYDDYGYDDSYDENYGYDYGYGYDNMSWTSEMAGPIAGGVLGGIFAVALLAVLCLQCRKSVSKTSKVTPVRSSSVDFTFLRYILELPASEQQLQKVHTTQEQVMPQRCCMHCGKAYGTADKFCHARWGGCGKQIDQDARVPNLSFESLGANDACVPGEPQLLSYRSSDA